MIAIVPNLRARPASAERKAARLPRGSAGFTLIELLVSSAILGIVMFIMLSTVNTSLSLWRTTEASIFSDREGRSANLLLAQDLANAVVPTNPALWPKVTADSLAFLTIRPASYQGTNSGEVGDLCFVEYRVGRDTNSKSTNFVALTRNFVPSRETYAAVKAGNLPVPDPAKAELLAANIVPNRRVLFYNTEITDTFFTALGTNSLPVTGTNRPAIIDVTLATADEQGVRTLDITNKQLRSAGYFSFRVALPRP